MQGNADLVLKTRIVAKHTDIGAGVFGETLQYFRSGGSMVQLRLVREMESCGVDDAYGGNCFRETIGNRASKICAQRIDPTFGVCERHHDDGALS